jgi:hypothetical protein
LLARGRNRFVPSAKRALQVEKYLAGWAADPVWRYPPISFLESRDYLGDHLDEFVPNQERAWSGRGTRVPLDKLVDGARGYSGQPIVSRGRLRQVILPASQPGAVITQFLLLESTGPARARAICSVNTARSRRFAEGQAIDFRGLVIDAGTMATSGTTTVKGVFVQCSEARVAPGRGR